MASVKRRETRIRLKVSAVIPVEYNGGNAYLLVHNRNDNLYSLPGGKVEPHDKNELAALQRELLEETGITDAIVTGFIGGYRIVHPGKVTCMNLVYSVKPIQTKPKIKISDQEIDEVRKCSIGEIRKFYSQGKMKGGMAYLKPIEDFERRGALPLETIVDIRY